jgi:RNA polymerase sigma factor (sigma-70 family)
MITIEPTVFLIDDDPAVRDSLSLFLGLKGFRIQPFSSAESFLDTYTDQRPGCLVLDVRLGGMDGLSLQSKMHERGINLPVIVMTAYGDVATARAALKGGAVDFLEKPIDVELLHKTVNDALDRDRAIRVQELEKRELESHLASLTEREKQVLNLVVDGKHNREIAAALGISPRTVEVHKARIMEKCRVPRLTDLLRIVLKNSLLQSSP